MNKTNIENKTLSDTIANGVLTDEEKEKFGITGVTTGYVMIPNDLSQCIMKHCSCNAFAVYHTLRMCKNDAADSCFPSIKRIKEYTGLSVQTISNAIQMLIDSGVLIVKSGSSNSGKGNVSNRYFFPAEEYLYTSEEFESFMNIKRRKNNIRKEKDTTTNNDKCEGENMLGEMINIDLISTDEVVEQEPKVMVQESEVLTGIAKVYLNYKNLGSYSKLMAVKENKLLEEKTYIDDNDKKQIIIAVENMIGRDDRCYQ